MTAQPETPEESPALETARRFAAAIPHGAAIGIEVVAAAHARTSLRLPWRAELVGNPDRGLLHGGAITTLIDSASGLAVFLALERPPAIATLDLRIDYLRPPGTGEAVIADAECYRLTRSIAFVRALAHHGDAGRPIAHGAATFKLDSPGGPLPASGARRP